MPEATPKEKRDMSNQAAKQVRLKIKLEKKLSKKLNRFFFVQNKKLKIRMANGDIYNAVEAMPELEEILRKHYGKVVRSFSPLVIAELNRSLRRVSRGRESKLKYEPSELDAILLSFILSNSKQSARLITNTTNRLITRYVNKYETDIGDENGTVKGGSKPKKTSASNFDELSKAEYVHGEMDARIPGRVRTISVTETQKASEGSKSKTAGFAGDALTANHGNVITQPDDDGGGVLFGALLIRTIKTWMTMMDAKVRSIHVMANFQEQYFDDPYMVGGEELMHPGDTSRGASMENISNCRCVSITRFGISL